jgi:hypothetical protein
MSTGSTTIPGTLGDPDDETPTSAGFTPFDAFDDTATDPGFEGGAPFGRSPSGLPLDSAGQEWDVVTLEGHGFNDSDGPTNMKSSVDGQPVFKADWGPLVDKDVTHFFECQAALEAARAQGEAMFEVALTSFRLRNDNQWQRVRCTFYRHFAASDARFAELTPVFGALVG